ncbi:Na+/H+ antiporter subunit E [Corynebacterium stationis]|uniref:Na+/H+ antiporter subunit E n=1 Tax=Corynebacterium stationis TaxID=1705 RepID=UPI00242B224E|nr:Na+/H+ antiporter subunit E [Corynebacterium stationis]
MNKYLTGARHRFRPTFILWLTIMWCLLMGEVTWANVFGGLLVSLGIVFLLPLPAMPISELNVSWGRLIRYMFIWTGELLWASVKVGWIAIRPGEKPKNAILRGPMRVENELVLSFAVVLYNLQPGGTVAEIDIANRMLTVHVLEATTQADIDREVANLVSLERHMISIFEGKHK